MHAIPSLRKRDFAPLKLATRWGMRLETRVAAPDSASGGLPTHERR